MREHYSLIRMASGQKNNDHIICWWKFGETGSLTFSKVVWQVLINLNMQLTTLWLSNWTLGYLSQRNKNLCSHKNMYKNIHYNLSLKAKIMKTAQTFFNGWMVTQSMVHLYNGILLSNKNESINDTHNLNESPGIMLSKKSQSPKGYILHNFIYKKFLKWQNCRNKNSVKEGVCMCDYKGQWEGCFWWWNYSVCWLY